MSLSILFLSLVGVTPPATCDPPISGPAQDPTYLGSHASTERDLPSPTAVAYDADGSLWVTSSEDDALIRIDPSGEREVFQGFPEASGVCVLPSGSVWVSCPVIGEVRTLSPTRERGPTIGGLIEPGGLHVLAGGDAFEVLLAERGASRLVVFDAKGQRLRRLGEGALKAPVDVTVARTRAGEQRVFAVDAGAHAVVVLDPATGAELRRFGAWGWFPGLFSTPGAIAAYEDRVFVCDTENHRIQVFTLDGERLHSVGIHAIKPREGRGKLHYPTGLAIRADGNELAIAEPFDDRVQRFARAPGAEPPDDPVRGTAGQPAAHFGFDWAASGGLLLVSEPESRRVQVYDLRLIPEEAKSGDEIVSLGAAPVLVADIGDFGTGLGFFQRPAGLWVDEALGLALICDPVARTLTEVRLDRDPSAPLGYRQSMVQFVRQLDFQTLGTSVAGLDLEAPIAPRAVARHSDGRMFVLCERNRAVFVIAADMHVAGRIAGHGTGPGQLTRPVSLILARDGESLYVADERQSKVCEYLLGGELVREITRSGDDPLKHPYGLAEAADGTLVISDSARDRLHFLATDGTLTSRGGRGIRRGEFLGPRAVAFDGAERLIVLDHGNHRGLLTTLDGDLYCAFGSRLYTLPARNPAAFTEEDYQE